MAKKKASSTTSADRNLAGLQSACRDGDTAALLAWADAVEAAGDGESAALLRDLPKAQKAIAKEVKKWCRSYPGTGQVNFFAPPKKDPWWFCGDCEIEGDEATDVVGPLLARWDQFQPAIEWLVRGLGLPFVERCSTPKGKSKRYSTAYPLADGVHFDPLPEGHSFHSILCKQADPTNDEG